MDGWGGAPQEGRERTVSKQKSTSRSDRHLVFVHDLFLACGELVGGFLKMSCVAEFLVGVLQARICGLTINA